MTTYSRLEHLRIFSFSRSESSRKQTPGRKSYPPLNVVLFLYIMSTVISLFVTVMNHSYISVSELPFFHIHVRLHLKIHTELYAFTLLYAFT